VHAGRRKGRALFREDFSLSSFDLSINRQQRQRAERES